MFVSSLPYNATTTDIVTHFSFIGPVHHGFIAKDKESGTSKGVGYVTYALKEDADRAIEELDGGAFGAKGRKIRVTMADRKVCCSFKVHEYLSAETVVLRLSSQSLEPSRY